MSSRCGGTIKMLTARLALLALSMTFAMPVAARPAAPTAAVPIGSPGDWLNPNDYPATALRYDMQGTTAFRLSVDAAGKPTRCEIATSSGFDVLDTATCDRLMTKAQFTPSRDHKGNAIAGTYSNRVRWVVPKGEQAPMTESFGSMVLSIDPTGKVTTCEMTIHVPATNVPTGKECESVPQSFPPSVAQEFRGNIQSPTATVEILVADAFTPELRARVLAPRPGYEQRGLSIHRFTVVDGGKLGSCAYSEQRGSSDVAMNFCLEAREEHFDPPFSAFDKDGVANGWHIMRVLAKTGA